MTLQVTLERVSAIRQALADPATMLGSSAAQAGGAEAPGAGAGTSSAGESSFAARLEQASAGYGAPSEASSAATAATLEGSNASAGTGLTDAADVSSPGALTGTTVPGSSYSLQSLDGVAGSAGLSPTDAAYQSSPGARIVAIAESQLGQTEQPPGSNESPAIAQYRSATAGAIPGAPWCAYFASWVAREAGAPIGEQGQGAGAVSEVWSWAQSTGRAIANGPGVAPKPGDLIVFGDEHVGIVRDVLPDGQIQTIEGNYENKVAANVRSPTEATGYVEMG
jgi:CHAP domain